MAKRKTRRATRSAAKRSRGPLLEGWWGKMSSQGRRRMLMVFVHAALLGLMAAGVYYGLTSADEYVHRLDRYHGPISVTLAGEPDWLARYGHVRDQIINEAEAAVRAEAVARSEDGPTDRPDWFNPRLARRVADRLAKRFGAVPPDRDAAPLANAYVARVVQVDKQLAGPQDADDSAFARRLVVTLEFRRPLAQIKFSVGQFSPVYYVLDEQAHVLEERLLAAADLPQITGFARELPRVYVGRTLAAADLQAGLGLAKRLSDEPYSGEISELDVSNFGRREPLASELVIVARAPSSAPGAGPQRIGWGVRLDSPDYHIESNDAKTKLAILLQIWKDHQGTLNLGAGPYDLWQTSRAIRLETKSPFASNGR